MNEETLELIEALANKISEVSKENGMLKLNLGLIQAAEDKETVSRENMNRYGQLFNFDIWTTRTTNALRAENIRTFKQLWNTSDKALLKIPNVGNSTLKEIKMMKTQRQKIHLFMLDEFTL